MEETTSLPYRSQRGGENRKKTTLPSPCRGKQSVRLAVAGVRPDGRLASHRLDHANGRLALQRAVQAYTGGGRTTVVRRLDGSPIFPARPDLHCSVAHSAGYGLAAVCGGPVGVDIERIRTHSPRVLSLIASPAEIHVLTRQGEDEDPVTQCWTIKESVLKGLRVGLAVAPRRLRLRPLRPGWFAVDVPDGPGWTVHSQRVDECYLAVAVLEVPDEFPTIDWH